MKRAVIVVAVALSLVLGACGDSHQRDEDARTKELIEALTTAP